MERLENIKLFLLEHRRIFIGTLLGILLILSGGYFLLYETYNQEEKILVGTSNLVKKNEEITSNIEELSKEDYCNITVDVKGEVKSPGIYQIECDSRVQDAIILAGGTTWKADTSVLNLSKKLVDEMVIIVYSKDKVANFVNTKEEEIKKQESCKNQIEIKNEACINLDSVDSSNSDTEIIGDTPVNNMISLNTASKEELMTLPGIGSSKADNIILYREENGVFKNVEELKNVKGIGDSIFEKIKTNITV